MASIKVMSWNIENLGRSKFELNGKNVVAAQPANRSFAAEYIATVIQSCGVDVLGIMELRAALGNDVARLVVDALPGNAGWNYSVSSQQQHTRQEEAVYIWKETAQLRPWTPAQNDNTPPTSLANTIDKDSMQPLTRTLTNNTPSLDSIYAALVASGYIRRDYKISFGAAYRVIPAKWSALKDGASIDFGVDRNNKSRNPGLNAAQMAILKDILIFTGIVLFPNKDERSPYLKYFTLGTNNPVQMLFSVLHFPGPDKTVLKPAIANLTLCDALVKSPNVLIMGDFNVMREKQMKQSFSQYQVAKNPKTKQWEFSVKELRKVADFFTVLTGTPLFATDLMGNLVNTSLSPRKMAKVDREEYRVNPFDKFFFKAQSVTSSDAHCIDLIGVMNYSKAELYKKAVAQSGMKFLRGKYSKAELNTVVVFGNILVKRKMAEQEEIAAKKQKLEAESTKKKNSAVATKRLAAQNSKTKTIQEQIDELQEDLEEMELLIEQLELATTTVPTTTAAAFVVYRIISDHLPIAVTLTF